MKSHDKGIEMYKTKFHYRKSLLMQQNELKKKPKLYGDFTIEDASFTLLQNTVN
jgi:hypothetical protein